MQRLQKYALWIALVLIIILMIVLLAGNYPLARPLVVSSAVLLAVGLGSVTSLKTYRYTAWILAAIISGLVYPSAFLSWGSFDLRNKWLILIVVQLVMFGMGTQMSLKDFAGIRTMGKGVVIGLLCQFSIMPLLGYALTKIFHFEPEIAAGIVLIGSCSSGLASNVMVYIAGANLTLSVTLTAIATLLAPLMTPFLMQLLAGTYIEIRFPDMCLQIIKIVIVPIGAAMLFDGLKTLSGRFRKRVWIAFAVSGMWLILLASGVWRPVIQEASAGIAMAVELISFLCGAVVFGVIFYFLTRVAPKVEQLMPFFSMFGIVYFTLVTTAASRENILQIGLTLVLVAILHNSMGYVLGYWFSRALRLDRESARTIAFEVGLQNGGMASGLAGVMGKLATLGLAAAVFSPWMNVSGSILANYWKRRKSRDRADSVQYRSLE